MCFICHAILSVFWFGGQYGRVQKGHEVGQSVLAETTRRCKFVSVKRVGGEGEGEARRLFKMQDDVVSPGVSH